jgi:hypothetical protein
MNIHKGLLVLSLAMVCQSAGSNAAEAQARPKPAEAQALAHVIKTQKGYYQGRLKARRVIRGQRSSLLPQPERLGSPRHY